MPSLNTQKIKSQKLREVCGKLLSSDVVPKKHLQPEHYHIDNPEDWTRVLKQKLPIYFKDMSNIKERTEM